ncbi:MAG: hypothetical protein ACJAYX_004749 [Planctomycetota bacterium]|jgi:hypothetical protein
MTTKNYPKMATTSQSTATAAQLLRVQIHHDLPSPPDRKLFPTSK